MCVVAVTPLVKILFRNEIDVDGGMCVRVKYTHIAEHLSTERVGVKYLHWTRSPGVL